MNSYQYNEVRIEIIDEPDYTYGSQDNNFNYSKIIWGRDAADHPTATYGIKVYNGETIIDSCIVIGNGQRSIISCHSSVLDGDRLVFCCCNKVFSISVPDLSLQWETEADPATCFQIFKYNNIYIIHGELQITGIDRKGHLIWRFGGADIFVNIDGQTEFVIEDDGILLTDFCGAKYKIDFDGKLLWDTVKR